MQNVHTKCKLFFKGLEKMGHDSDVFQGKREGTSVLQAQMLLGDDPLGFTLIIQVKVVDQRLIGSFSVGTWALEVRLLVGVYAY